MRCCGLGNPTYETSPAGWDMVVQVNVLSTAQGLARLTAGEAGPRVVVNAVYPDLCRTDLSRKWDGTGTNIGKPVFYSLFTRAAE